VSSPPVRPRGAFPETNYSAVLGVRADDPIARARSFEILAQTYWRPTYKYLRVKWRKTAEECRDLSQDFFAIAYEKRFFDSYDPGKARFRTFFRLCLDRFAAKREQARRRLIRGGGAPILSLDVEQVEAELARAGDVDPSATDGYFDAEWTRSLLGSALEQFQRHCEKRQRPVTYQLFERLAFADDVEPKPTYAALAAEHGMSLVEVTSQVSYARREFRRIVLERLRQVTATEEEFREEARAVLGIDVQ
jgi:hypothetical protein